MTVRLLLFCCAVALLAVPAAAESRLRTVSLRLVEVYNAGDGALAAGLLAPGLRNGRSEAELTAWLAGLHSRYGRLERVSLPLYGNGAPDTAIFAAYFETCARDLFLSLDAEGRIEQLFIRGPEPETEQ
ncbi:MAG TPA: hypothetical protein VFO41_12805 [Alphaproteobacteria bacterium]|nr:hypothetical protein [Alphaproteobacteria bacterium]